MSKREAQKAPFLQLRRYGILGAGRSGLAAAYLLLDLNKDVVLFDDFAEPKATPLAALSERGVQLCLGPAAASLGGDIEALVVFPGFPAAHPLLAQAAARDLPVLSEMELGWLCSGASRIVAITGTNGKTTVTMLVQKICEDAGLRSVSAGNIGLPLCDAVRQSGAELDRTVFSLEVSSFQLETCQQFTPDIAVILNITPDHLDRHPTMDLYARAKEKITGNQGAEQTLIVNQDDLFCLGIATRSRAKVKRFSLERPVDNGAWLDGDLITLTQKDRKPHRLMSMSDLQMIGLHNVANAMAAACVAETLGLERKPLAASLAAFRAAPHRMEFVAAHAGITFIDDSKATNLDALCRAIESFSEGIHLIAGGRDKNSPFATITQELLGRVKAIYLIGEAAGPMADAWAAALECIQCGTLDRALAEAVARARPGESILLSPGCASFDQFRSYAHRGEQFAQWVRQYLAENTEKEDGPPALNTL